MSATHASTQHGSCSRLAVLLLTAAALLALSGEAQAKPKATRPKTEHAAAVDVVAPAVVAAPAVSAEPSAAGSVNVDAAQAASPAMISSQPTAAAPSGQAEGAGAGAQAQPAQASDQSRPSAGALSAAAVSPEEHTKLAGLRGELTTLMDDLVEARSRAAILGKTLFKTRLSVRLQNLAGPDPVLAKVVLALDGAPIYRGDAAALGGDEARAVFEGFVAPGPHVLGVEVEQRARDDAAYGYTLHESYRVQAPREKKTELTLVLDDDSDMAGDFPDDGDGKYDVRVRLRAKTRAWDER